MYTSRQDLPMLSISAFLPTSGHCATCRLILAIFPSEELAMQSFCVVCKKKSSPQSERAMYMSVCVLCIRVCVCVYVVFVRVCLCGCTIVCLEAEPPNQFIQESIRIKGEAVSLYGERSTPISTSQKWLRWRASAGAEARKMNSNSIFCDMSLLV